jgi:hypothetical protein
MMRTRPELLALAFLSLAVPSLTALAEGVAYSDLEG